MTCKSLLSHIAIALVLALGVFSVATSAHAATTWSFDPSSNIYGTAPEITINMNVDPQYCVFEPGVGDTYEVYIYADTGQEVFFNFDSRGPNCPFADVYTDFADWCSIHADSPCSYGTYYTVFLAFDDVGNELISGSQDCLDGGGSLASCQSGDVWANRGTFVWSEEQITGTVVMGGWMDSTSISGMGVELAAETSTNFSSIFYLVVIALAVPVTFYLIDRSSDSVAPSKKGGIDFTSRETMMESMTKEERRAYDRDLRNRARDYITRKITGRALTLEEEAGFTEVQAFSDAVRSEAEKMYGDVHAEDYGGITKEEWMSEVMGDDGINNPSTIEEREEFLQGAVDSMKGPNLSH